MIDERQPCGRIVCEMIMQTFESRKYYKDYITVIKTEYWVIVYESHDSDVIIFVILFANSSDDTGLMW